MRVALRRLRLVLRMADTVCADEQLAALSNDVAILVPAWDGCVNGMCLSPNSTAYVHAHAGHEGLQALLESSQRQRNDCYSLLRDDAHARDLQRLMLRFAIWMNGPYWQQQAGLGCSYAISRQLI